MRSAATINRLRGDCSAAVGAEFAVVLPLLLLLLFGMIDVGRYMWSINMLEKATQVGARWAAVTDTVASGLNTKEFGASLGQGAKIPASAFGKMHCDKFSGTLTCTCDSNCSGIAMTANSAAFTAMTNRMSQIAPMLTDQNVRITYTNSGLGYAGDPSVNSIPPSPQVAPVITVSTNNVSFSPFAFLGFSIKLPVESASMTMEDSVGPSSN
jgi:Flp pilus assembly protein TadG